jgi:hypothetical protein
MLLPVNRRAWILFACWQFVAIVFGIAAERLVRSDWGAHLFLASFVGLLPGDYLSVLSVERLFLEPPHDPSADVGFSDSSRIPLVTGDGLASKSDDNPSPVIQLPVTPFIRPIMMPALV